jgi:RsiW-degrading membrane proteinase PrsW (M82 family)
MKHKSDWTDEFSLIPIIIAVTLIMLCVFLIGEFGG